MLIVSHSVTNAVRFLGVCIGIPMSLRIAVPILLRVNHLVS